MGLPDLKIISNAIAASLLGALRIGLRLEPLRLWGWVVEKVLRTKPSLSMGSAHAMKPDAQAQSPRETESPQGQSSQTGSPLLDAAASASQEHTTPLPAWPSAAVAPRAEAVPLPKQTEPLRKAPQRKPAASRDPADTPMMRQFQELKAAHPECILFFRAGDFYEMFGEDARRAAQVLDIALTTRNRATPQAIPMCGVPYHAYENYLHKLSAAGFKVAIAEQMEDAASARGLVRREVVRVITPGTLVSGPLVAAERNHYLMAIALPHEVSAAGTEAYGAAWADLSTGRFAFASFTQRAPAQLAQELPVQAQLVDLCTLERPREILFSASAAAQSDELRREISLRIGRRTPVHFESLPAENFDLQGARERMQERYGADSLSHTELEAHPAALAAAGALYRYLETTQKRALTHLLPPQQHRLTECMHLEEATLRHLAVLEGADGSTRQSLFGVLNHTRSAMGARLLRHWMLHPLRDVRRIEARLGAVETLLRQGIARTQARESMQRCGDLERIVGRINLPQAGLSELFALRASLEALAALQAFFADPAIQGRKPQSGVAQDSASQGTGLPEPREGLLSQLAEDFDPQMHLLEHLRTHLAEAPLGKQAEEGFIASGVSGALDQHRERMRTVREQIAQLEAQERKRSGISTLKIRFNRIFGYSIEIPRAQAARAPQDYRRRQTLVNAERYTNDTLTVLEDALRGAEEQAAALEAEAFQETLAIVRGYTRRLQLQAHGLATLDVCCALAECAHRYRYTRPRLCDTGTARLDITAGRHPLIERVQSEPFVPNDLRLDAEQRQMLLITGPNMAGKSTVMRQTALIQLLAQMGSFVPADAAELCLADRIFTRVGAADDLARGQSTFMTEMTEAASILRHATPLSLVLLDEIGRGTSTYDGIGLAWATVERLHGIGALTLFATHYHELTRLEAALPRLANVHLSIEEEQGRLIFTRKLRAGGMRRSYGLQVARLAGMPQVVIDRAREVMRSFSTDSGGSATADPKQATQRSTQLPERAPALELPLAALPQLSHEALDWLRTLKIEETTPLEALLALQRLQGMLNKQH